MSHLVCVCGGEDKDGSVDVEMACNVSFGVCVCGWGGEDKDGSVDVEMGCHVSFGMWGGWGVRRQG